MKSWTIVTQFCHVVETMDLTTHRPDMSSVVHHSGDNFCITSGNYVSPNVANAPGPRAAKSVFSIRSIVEESKNGISSSSGKSNVRKCFKPYRMAAFDLRLELGLILGFILKRMIQNCGHLDYITSTPNEIIHSSLHTILIIATIQNCDCVYCFTPNFEYCFIQTAKSMQRTISL